MRKVIDHKIYDTDRALDIGTWDNGEEPWSYQFVYKALFKRKRPGEPRYFLNVWGGPQTAYFEEHDGCKCAGEWIIPLSTEEAYEFAVEHFPEEIWRTEFW